MGSIWKENWKRGAKKNIVPARDEHDLVRREDQTNLTTNASGVGGHPVGTFTTGEYLYFDGLDVVSSGVAETPPFVFFRAEAGIAHTANPAAFTTTGNGTGALLFDDTTQETIVFLGATSSVWSAGDITVTIHWGSSSQTTGDVKWDVSFERQNTTLASDSFATAQSATTTVGGVVNITTTSQIVFTAAQADGLLAGESFRLRLQRDPAVGGDMTGDAFVPLVTVSQ